MFQKIGFTLPGPSKPSEAELRKEAAKITEFLESGRVDMFHIRKPDWDKETTAQLISEIPGTLHPKLKLHDHFSLLGKFNLGGVHLNSRNPVPPSTAASVSKSLHSIEELIQSCGTCYDYVTLSPIYDSISKSGYHSPFPKDLTILTPLIKGKHVVALGGVSEDKLDELKHAGFYGGAMLGALWEEH